MQQSISPQILPEDYTSQIPPPPIVLPEGIKSDPALSSEVESLTLLKSVPYSFHNITLTLDGFNHKFQDNPDESYVWIDVIATDMVNTGVTKKLVFDVNRFLDEDGKTKTIYSRSEFGGYMFELIDQGYDYNIVLDVRKIID